jgi:hypothetical protein
MVDTVDSLLNNAVDFYVQVVDYCQISTSQIPTLVSARIRQIKPESGDVQQMSSDSGDTMPDSGYIAGSRPERRRSGHLAGILAGILDGSGQNGRTPGIWLDPAVLAESPANWPETGQDGRLPVN